MVYYGELQARGDDNTINELDKNHRKYIFDIDPQYINYMFTEEEKSILRPIAETISMLAGNAFFGFDTQDYHQYEQYLPEAATIYYANGEPKKVSWLIDREHESDAVEIAWKSWRTLKELSKTDPE